jgi:UDP-2-acetamido-2,6-beta-L-arabino-hexul-4-ose reductase
MRVLVTGARGFIGKNLAIALGRRAGVELLSYDLDTGVERLEGLVGQADAVFHLAGVNRPERVEEFRQGNTDLTERVCAVLEASGRKPLLVLSSSIQAGLDNPYGESKRAAEDAALAFGRRSGAKVRVFRLPGVFGKWSRPNYNSVVATFCHNVARGLPIAVSDPARVVELVHVDDVVRTLVALLDGVGPAEVLRQSGTSMDLAGLLAEEIQAFRDSRGTLEVPDFGDTSRAC